MKMIDAYKEEGKKMFGPVLGGWLTREGHRWTIQEVVNFKADVILGDAARAVYEEYLKERQREELFKIWTEP
jgi:hypothetical protein